MVNKLILNRATWLRMRRHVRRYAPLEACGLLAGKEERVERSTGIPNTEQSAVRFRMRAVEQWRAFQQMEAEGLELVGIYHSHPEGPEEPSPTDIAENLYPVAQVIWSRVRGSWQARAFTIENGKAREIPLDIIE
jgi:proteasome lid subunit RPN8/RPN11